MALTDEDFNKFAEGLARGYTLRLVGLDSDSARLISVRPADHVLCGFLMPSARPSGSQDSGENPSENGGPDAVDDLPRDSAHNQSAFGLSWAAPLQALMEAPEIRVEVLTCVYVRRLPGFEEQRRQQQVAWRRERIEETPASTARFTEPIPVWTREKLPPMVRTLNVGDLLRRRAVAPELVEDMAAAVAELDRAALYPGRRPIRLWESTLASESAYADWVNSSSAPDNLPDWRPVIDARVSAITGEPDLLRVSVRLINRTNPIGAASQAFVDGNLYAVHLAVTLPRAAHRPMAFQELPASFRFDRLMAGVGINAQVEMREEGDFITLIAQSVPTKNVPRLEPREIPGAAPTYEILARDPVPVLRRIHAEMEFYSNTEWRERVERLDGLERLQAVEASNAFREEAGRFLRGIDLLSNDRYPLVQRAFAFMNRAMAAATSFSEWRLFQIVFIVSQLPTLAARQYPELLADDDDAVDVLWFAAGGGKTEAFLGVIVWQAFFDRLRGKGLGVAAFLRFPLRLLTFQQLGRLSRALAAAEIVRRREALGGVRFSMGYFVGKGVTPNQISRELHSQLAAEGVDERYRRVFQCPFCQAPVDVRYDPDLRLIQHMCSSPDCPGGRERLPIYIVDDDLYHYLPTVVVSTVDKLAILGQNQRFANLLGRFDLYCDRHGANFGGDPSGLCEAAKEWAQRRRVTACGSSEVRWAPFLDPGPSILVQDELHLLSKELGTFDSHYETAVTSLSRSLGFNPWKIIAATATIEEYETHVKQLYLRPARQFPGPGPAAYDSFYYRQSTTRLGRLFIGALGVGRKHTPAVTRALTLLYLELNSIRRLASTDLDEASRRYGDRRLSEIEFQELLFLYELPLTYVLTRKGSDQVAEAIESRVKSELQELAPDYGSLLIDLFNGGVEVGEMIRQIETIQNAPSDGDPSARVRGIVTTNIIGHGVDVDRFNVIVFAGFTRLVAEYIQASARVGRKYPGISIFGPTPQSERDRSIFDRFAKFHEYLDRLVDPCAVNRWPEPALQRTLPGLLCGYVMGFASRELGRRLATVEAVQDAYGLAGSEALNTDAVVQWLRGAYGADGAPNPRYGERLNFFARNRYALITNSPRQQRGGQPRALGRFLDSMESLRDVDEPAEVRVGKPTELAILRRLTNA